MRGLGEIIRMNREAQSPVQDNQPLSPEVELEFYEAFADVLHKLDEPGYTFVEAFEEIKELFKTYS